MCVQAHRHTLFCVLPPYVLRSISEHGTPEQRADAARALTIDSTFRAMRAAHVAPGAAVPRSPSPAMDKQRTIFDTRNSQQLPGTQVRAEGEGPTGDVAVDEAYDGLGHTFDFYQQVYGRNSIDDEGMPLNATVHFGVRYNNAFWNSEQMVFGDGDGRIFTRFTISLDVIGHELAHGVTEDEAGLEYFYQSGALNESMSDVFGSLVKQFALQQQADQADWLIGAGLFAPGVQGVALRSMKAPGTAFDDPVIGKDPQPAHMDDFVNTWEDNRGVHINSGIPNKAFSLAATKIGGFAWERTGRIWYDALRDSAVRPNTGFRRFARITVAKAAALGQIEAQAVREAWAEVGIVVPMPAVAQMTMRAGG
jgi:Zn-dependent metalloprotease